MLRRGFLVHDEDGHRNKEFFNAYHNFSDEFISGILLAKVIYRLPLSVVGTYRLRSRSMSTGTVERFYQGPLLRRRVCHPLGPRSISPPKNIPLTCRLLSNFVHIAMDYAQVNGSQPGPLSEC